MALPGYVRKVVHGVHIGSRNNAGLSDRLTFACAHFEPFLALASCLAVAGAPAPLILMGEAHWVIGEKQG
jgi:hypothetical protein